MGDAYGATLGRIKAQGKEKARLGMAVLMWISHSKRPLQTDEICHAIAIRIGSNDLDNDDVPTISTLLDCCQGLATIEKGTSTARLIHFTLQEYLCTHPDLFNRTHSKMAEMCLTYLNSQNVKDFSAGPPPDPRSTPFLEYSSLYWGTHMRLEVSDLAKEFALQLLSQFNDHISAKSLWKSINGGLPSWNEPGDRPFSALHCISYFGIPDVANILITMNRWDVNEIDSTGTTPLIWAAKYGNEEVVRLLLWKKHIQPDQPDAKSGRTALSWAAGNGHEGVVRLFLASRSVNPESIGLWWGKAAHIVDVLFGGRYVNPDSASNIDRTPLSWAAENGHEGIVKLLLGRRGVNPDSSRISGRTPLSLASENGHEGIVKLLLGREEVSPDCSSIFRQTPLSLAAENGYEGIVKLLLGRKDVSPDGSRSFGQAPLSLAAENGHEGIVKLLLSRKDVSPDGPSSFRQTPLSLAAQNNHEGIVELLLGRRDIDPNSTSKSGRTPLSWAAENGYEGIAKLLLGREDTNPDTRDIYCGRTPLSWAAKNGHEGIVKLLLGRKDVNPDSSSKSGRTPLSFAAGNGHEGIVRLLLARKDVNPNSSSKSGETPLALATRRWHHQVAELLRARQSRRIR